MFESKYLSWLQKKIKACFLLDPKYFVNIKKVCVLTQSQLKARKFVIVTVARGDW